MNIIKSFDLKLDRTRTFNLELHLRKSTAARRGSQCTVCTAVPTAGAVSVLSDGLVLT